MKQEKRPCTWYIEPLNQITNAILADVVDCAEEKFIKEVEDTKGDRHDVWELPSFLKVNFFLKSTHSSLDFKVFNKRGNGRLNDVTKFFTSKKKKNKPTK